MSTTFVSINGDFPNIGDAIIRRLAFDWVRAEHGNVVYAANAPEMWLRQVHVSSDDVVVRGRENFWAWAKQVLRAPRRSVLLLEPGEVILDRASARREAGLLALALATRVKGGVVILPPRAAVRPDRLTLFLHRQICRLSNVVLWRNIDSELVVGVGAPSPDIAFSAGVREGLPSLERENLVISLRGHRPVPSDDWFTGISEFAEQNGLSVVTLSQVFGDEGRNAEVAGRLGGTHIPWAEGGDLDHEARVRDVYDNSRLVVSDRLHVLIIASLSGAVPAEIVVDPAPKVRTHFERIGFYGVSLDANGASSSSISDHLQTQIARSAELRLRVDAAADELAQSREKVQQLINDRVLAKRPVSTR